MDDHDSTDDKEDFQIESTFKQKKETKKPENTKKPCFTQDLGTNMKWTEMNCFLVDILPESLITKFMHLRCWRNHSSQEKVSFMLNVG